MHFRHALLLLLLILSFGAQAYELIMVQAVSDSRRTFITRNGKRQGIIPGVTGTFTAEDISILAKATKVTGEYTHWEIINPEAQLPFEKGTIVTYYPATEYLWTLSPEEVRQKYIKSQNPPTRQAIVVKGAISRGLAESVSNAPASESERGGYVTEAFYERELNKYFAFDVGFRYDAEVVNYENTTFVTQRNILVADLIYYFRVWKEYIPGRFFVAVGAGYGRSSTSTTGLKQSGLVGILPSVRAGMTYPMSDNWEMGFEGGLESLQTKEEQFSGVEQTTTQTNARFSLGLRRFF